jgi:hypothetical protein
VLWDESKLTRAQVVEQLRAGDPSIEVVPETKPGIEIASWMLQDGEAEIIARRLGAILTKGAKR